MRVRDIWIILFSVITLSLNSTAVVWEFNDSEGWYPGNEYVQNFQINNSALSFHITGGDPCILSPNNVGIKGSDFCFLHTEIEFSSNITGNAQMYFITEEDSNWSEDKVIYFKAIPGRHTYLINIPKKMQFPDKWLEQTIYQIRFDPPEYQESNVKIYWFGITYGSVWEFSTDGNYEGWGEFNCVENHQVVNGYLYLEFNCRDPYIHSPYGLRLNGRNYPWLQADIEYSAEQEHWFQLFFIHSSDENWDEQKSIVFPAYLGRHIYLINIPQTLSDLGKSPLLWNENTITQIRFDTGGVYPGNIKIHWVGLGRDSAFQGNGQAPASERVKIYPSGNIKVEEEGTLDLRAQLMDIAEPYSIRWIHNDEEITGALQSRLTIRNVNINHEGLYQCVVTDSAKSILYSQPVNVSIVPQGTIPVTTSLSITMTIIFFLVAGWIYIHKKRVFLLKRSK